MNMTVRTEINISLQITVAGHKDLLDTILQTQCWHLYASRGRVTFQPGINFYQIVGALN